MYKKRVYKYRRFPRIEGEFVQGVEKTTKLN